MGLSLIHPFGLRQKVFQGNLRVPQQAVGPGQEAAAASFKTLKRRQKIGIKMATCLATANRASMGVPAAAFSG